jgi:hypothetical protein
MADKRTSGFQRRSSESGAAFANECRIFLEGIGFGLLGKKVLDESGVEVAQIAKNAVGELLYFEFKGSYVGVRPGLRRTDTVKKVVCDGFLLTSTGYGPLIVITSHKPKGGRAHTMLKCAEDVIFDVIAIHDDEDRARLESYLEGLPWRQAAVAKRRSGLPDGADVPTQRSLFGIKVLQPFSRTAETVNRRSARKRSAR